MNNHHVEYVMQVIKSDFTARGIGADPMKDAMGNKFLLLTFKTGEQVLINAMPTNPIVPDSTPKKQTKPRWSE